MTGRKVSVYYIGPESKVWHRRRDCPALLNPWRYYPLRAASGRKARAVQATRRACKRCAR